MPRKLVTPSPVSPRSVPYLVCTVGLITALCHRSANTNTGRRAATSASAVSHDGHMRSGLGWLAGLGLAVLAAAGCSGSTPPGIGVQRGNGSVTSEPASGQPGTPGGATGPRPGAVPRPLHTVVVVLENHSYSDIIGNKQARYISRLASQGALLTASYAVTHPSEPNYLALFSGSTHGVTSDQRPTLIRPATLGADLIAAHLTFAGYSEGLPARGSSAWDQGGYARKHVPWTDFSTVPRSVNEPFSQFPAGDFAMLPTVSFVIPDLCDDMHDCS